jgi:hypothetical protein
MSVGGTISKAEIDNTAHAVAASIFASLSNVAKFKAVLDGYSSAQLVSVFGYASTAEADILKSAITDLDKLRQIFEGTATQSSASDFRFFAKQLLGTGLY